MIDRAATPTEDTFPKLLLRNYRQWGKARVAMRQKKFGVWAEYTWDDCYEIVKVLSLGLITAGLEAGDMVAILGDNCVEWFWLQLAVQSAGAVPVGLISDNTAKEVEYLLTHSQSRLVAAQDQEQVDKVLEVADNLPLLRRIVYWDDKGLRHYRDHRLISFSQLCRLGEDYARVRPGVFEDNVSRGNGDQPFILQYTSGTTALPKAVVTSYSVFMSGNEATRVSNPAYTGDEYVSVTLPGWAMEQGLGLLYCLAVGQIFNFAEGTDTIERDLREIAPHTVSYPSRLWEQVCSTIQMKIADSIWLKRKLYELVLPIGYKAADLSIGGSITHPFWRILHTVAEVTVFRPLRDKHGLIRVRVPYTAGAMLAPDVLRFFRAIGVNLRQVYGSTEVGIISSHTADDFKFESVGRIAFSRCVRITEEGEILADKQYSFSEYLRDPEATQKAFDGSWFHTGDAGYIDEDGHLFFIDRLTDMHELGSGSKFSPQYIESRLKFSALIKDALCFGGTGADQDFIASLVAMDFDNVGHWAEKCGLTYTTFADLSQKDQVLNLIRREVDRVNKTLPPASRIRAFINLPKEFDPDDAEMTRTRKIRRGFVQNRYGDVVKAIYSGRQEALVEAPVVYRSGETGYMRTKVKVVRI